MPTAAFGGGASQGVRGVRRAREVPTCETHARAAPFETCQTYRLSVPGPGGRTGHPQAGAVRYGVVHATKVIYCVHMVRSMDDEGLYRLNTDVWLPYL